MDILPELPACIRAATEGYRWTRVNFGQSGATLYRLDHPDQTAASNEISAAPPSLYLKFATGIVAQEILAEANRLQWLAPHLPVPKVQTLHYAADQACLLTTALPGQNAFDALTSNPDSRALIVESVAEFLHRLHAIPTDACPFNSSHHLRMIAARHNIDEGRIYAHDFDENHEGWTGEQIWTELKTFLPLSTENVITHGDFSLGNILIRDCKVTGCIDVSRVGTADPYQDLAILWNDLSRFGPEIQQLLFNSYGITTPDSKKLQFHLCLDELF